MSSVTNSYAVESLHGFDVYLLNNEEAELAVVPELGAKIISLRNLRTGREWMWHPAGGLNLFRNHLDDDFSRSPLVGADECLPTIAPCSWQGRELPDHGEIWNVPWIMDLDALESGILRTSVRLKISPFEFQRTIKLDGNEIHLGYQLRNFGAQAENFLWAFHPLLNLEPGDQLELPPATRTLLNGSPWIDAIDSSVPEKKCDKIFAKSVGEGFAAIANSDTGDRLEFAWNPSENDALGLWLTRGGWHGHHHFSIEPTNACTDALALAAAQNHCGVVGKDDVSTWQIRLRLGA